jgi:transcriptional regulatory protein LevR
VNRKILTSFLIVFVSLGLLTGATCHKNQPRHQTTGNLTAVTLSLQALQAGEKTLYDAHTVPQFTEAAHKTFNAKLFQIWTAMDNAVVVVQAWTPGQPVPKQLTVLLEKVRVLLNDSVAVFGGKLPDQVNAVWSSVTAVLMFFVGGAA